MTTRMFWSERPSTVWKKNDIITIFESAIYEDEAHTKPFDLQGLQVKAVIRSDDDFSMKFKTNVTLKTQEKFQIKFKVGEIPEIGLWKIEFSITKGNEEIGMTHHDDFDVEI